MATTNSAPLPPAWTKILEQIETALSNSLNQVPECGGEVSSAAPLTLVAEPEPNANWPRALATAESSASASETELARAEQMLRDWLEAVQSSRARLEAAAFLRI
ncbi:hypothetical protein BH10PLA2_BH10PLA2_14710 [soil metagenome]